MAAKGISPTLKKVEKKRRTIAEIANARIFALDMTAFQTMYCLVIKRPNMGIGIVRHGRSAGK
jgi:hypothetical protein